MVRHAGRTMRRVAASALVAAALAGCAQTGSREVPGTGRARPLVAGVVADSPPYGFVENARPVGLEADLAARLGDALGRPVQVVALPFEQLFGALAAGRVDILMAGLSVTRAREARVAFGQPYLRGGLLAAMRREDRQRYDSPERVLAAETVGVVSGTTGATFVQSRVDPYRVREYRRPRDAMNELAQRRVDVVVHDAPVVVWFVSGNEAALALLPTLLQREDLAWAMRYEDAALRGDVDGVLARWRSDGTLDAVIARWLPYWSQLRER